MTVKAETVLKYYCPEYEHDGTEPVESVMARQAAGIRFATACSACRVSIVGPEAAQYKVVFAELGSYGMLGSFKVVKVAQDKNVGSMRKPTREASIGLSVFFDAKSMYVLEDLSTYITDMIEKFMLRVNNLSGVHVEMASNNGLFSTIEDDEESLARTKRVCLTCHKWDYYWLHRCNGAPASATGESHEDASILS